MRQSLLFRREPLKIVPAPNAPGLIVRRFAVWDGDLKLVRDIANLGPGLNIVWSEDTETRPGHDAGKTMFCRLLRYALGDTLRSDIRERLMVGLGSDARVGVVLEVNGFELSMVRSICRPQLGLVRDGVDIDQLATAPELQIRTPFASYINALASVVQPLSPIDDWAILLATCTRDQETRLDRLALWRVPVQGSEDERQRVLLRLLGMFSAVLDDERKAKQSGAKTHQDSKDALGYDRFRVQAIRSRLSKKLGLPNDSGLDIPVVAEAFRRKAQAELQTMKSSPPTLVDAQARVEELERKRVELTSAVGDAHRGLEGHAKFVAELRRLKSIESGKMLDLDAAKWRDEVAECPICKQPIGSAEARKCIHQEREQAKSRHQRYLDDMDRQIVGRLGEIQELSVLKESRERDLVRLTGDIETAKVAVAAAQDGHNRTIAMAMVTLDEAEEYAQIVARLQESTPGVSRQEVSSERRSSVRPEVSIRKKRARFNEIYGGVVEQILGGDAEAKLDFRENHVSAHLERNGQTFSVVQVLAFDLAAMLMRVEGASPGPAFLVHDSPRETDMSAAVYRAYLEFCVGLEKHIGGSFQMFVTTTTAPPTELWDHVQLKVKGAPDEERLLRRSL